MKKTLVCMLVLLALLGNSTLPAQAQTADVVVDTFMVTDGASHPSELSTCQAFTTGSAIYLPEGTPGVHAVVTFGGGYIPESNSTGHVSAGLMGRGDMVYDEQSASWEWDGLLLPADQGPSELWVSVGDNVFYNTTTQFQLTVEVDGFDPVAKIFTLINTCEAPPPETVNVTASTWVSDDIGGSGETSLTTTVGFTTGAAFYHNANHALPVNLVLQGYDSDMAPEIHFGASVVVSPVYDPATGTYTWVGDFAPYAATEFWVNVTNNTFYQETREYTWTVTSVEMGEPFQIVYSVTNPAEPPPVAQVHAVYLPIVTVPAAPEASQVNLDVSASDGTNDSRATGTLITDRAFSINLAVYPKTSDPIGEVTLTVASFTGLEPTTFNKAVGLEGASNYVAGTWTWIGTLKVGLNPSEFWINVPAGVLVGSRVFTVTVSQPGYQDAIGVVTVTTP
ncbi:hypothetical protein GYA27_01230 [candidate division WWE3 bacterium]|uniref:Uncharacterized protein n=1 Tax=candidate division WWE3 bacterium TaxID=2053526 RepID=A0A7X9DJU5_UNCKA|nr:hypothetical protein [candidate division WWE3 bacterium]